MRWPTVTAPAMRDGVDDATVRKPNAPARARAQAAAQRNVGWPWRLVVGGDFVSLECRNAHGPLDILPLRLIYMYKIPRAVSSKKAVRKDI